MRRKKTRKRKTILALNAEDEAGLMEAFIEATTVNPAPRMSYGVWRARVQALLRAAECDTSPDDSLCHLIWPTTSPVEFVSLLRTGRSVPATTLADRLIYAGNT